MTTATHNQDSKTETEKKPGFDGQTFLVGERIYLRSFVPGDEKNAMSWRASIFPKSPELIEKWIKDQLPKEGQSKRAHLAIVRKSDDVVVGNIIARFGDVGESLHPYVDELYGDAGQEWMAEAILLVTHWQLEECYRPRVDVTLGAHQQVAIDALLADGYVQLARWREKIERHGQRVDEILLGYFSKAWIDRIGDPLQEDVPQVGSGEVQPVPAKGMLENDPPKQAVMVGQRIYLRPQDKDDAKNYVAGERKETEPFFSTGRQLMTLQAWEGRISGQGNEDFPTVLWFEVCLRENDESIGSVGLLDIDYVNMTAETGSHFHNPDIRGKGYGTEAKHLLLEYTFNVLGMHMVTSYVIFANTRSAAALRKQGYTEAGRSCWDFPYEGGFSGMLTFDLTAAEWRALPRDTE